ncbi:hypothetical protein ACJBUE_22975 (plasmid) [Ralstonia syzygii subsp. celebesensis]|uniref:hypothetical protein n=1 Tax=Ralstonia syzygii TaxID=28097 RepID=UPI00387E1C96
MNALPQNMDQFGFAAAASTLLSSADLDRAANAVWEDCRRALAILRTLHHQLVNASRDEVNLQDVEAMVGLAVAALPDMDEGAFDAIDKFGRDTRGKVTALLGRQHAMVAVMDALETVARADATLEEVNAAAQAVHANASLLPDGVCRWEHFCALLAARQLHVVWYPSLGSLPPKPEVHSEESRQTLRKVRRKRDAFTSAVGELERQRAGAVMPVKKHPASATPRKRSR